MIELTDVRLFLVYGAPLAAALAVFAGARLPWLWTRVVVAIAGNAAGLVVASIATANILSRGGFKVVDIGGWTGAVVSGVDPFGLVPSSLTPSNAPLLIAVELAGLLATILLAPAAAQAKTTAPLAPALCGTAFVAMLVVARRIEAMSAAFSLAALAGTALLASFRPQRADVEGSVRAFLLHRVGDACLLAAVFIAGAAAGGIDLEHLPATAPLIEPWTRAASGPLAGFAAREIWLLLAALVAAAAASRLAYALLLPLVRDAVGAPGAAVGFAHGVCFLGAGLALLSRTAPMLWLAPEVLTALGYVAAASVAGASLFALAGRDVVRIDVHLLCAFAALASIPIAAADLGTAAFAPVLVVVAAVPLCAASGVVVAVTGRADPHSLGGLEHVLPRTHTTRLIVTGALFGSIFSGALAAAHIAGDALLAPWLGVWPAVIVVASLPIAALAAFRPLHLVFTGKSTREPHAQSLKEPPPWRTWPALAVALPLLGIGLAHIPLGVLSALPIGVTYGSPVDALVRPELAALHELRFHVAALFTAPSISPTTLDVLVFAALALGWLSSRVLYAGGPGRVHRALFGGARVQRVVAVLANAAGRESQVAKAAGEGAARLSRLIATNLAPGVLDTLLRRIPGFVAALLGYIVRFIANGSAQRGLVVALVVLAILALVLR